MPELIEIKDELQKGITFHRKGQLHQAELRYQKTLQTHPKNAEAYLKNEKALKIAKKNDDTKERITNSL